MDNRLNGTSSIPIFIEKGAIGMVSFIKGYAKKDDPLSMDIYSDLAVTPVQTHSLNVGMVNDRSENGFENTDALITFSKDIPIGVRTADCVPILLFAQDISGIAAIHAGWRGTLGGIVDRVIDIFVEKKADLSLLKAAFGPSVSKEIYEVDFELAQKFIDCGFDEYVSYPNGEDRRPHLDLQGINIERLIRRGVRKENIKPTSHCTYNSKSSDGRFLFPSYRREKETSERLLTWIMIN
ncbi:MAG: polyphenol oxidase family protein [Muribaculaceae bacterium]|nr:polyphenol oxidase family protein [Muribaculaceae bacterium]